MFTSAKAKLDSKVKLAKTWSEFLEHLNQRNAV